MIDLIKRGKLNQTTVELYLRGKAPSMMQTDSEFELLFPFECKEELETALKDEIATELINLPLPNGKDLTVQHFKCVEVGEPQSDGSIKAFFVGVVMNRKVFKCISSEIMKREDGSDTDITQEVYSLID